MKHLATLIGLMLFALVANADNIFTDLKTDKSGEGKVTISQSSEISNLLDKKKAEWANKKQLTFSGYRVQVYMGNQQKKSKDEASVREANIKARFPELKTYMTFSSPFWKLKVGNFRTHAEALKVANQLKNEFKWGGDIYIVRDSEVYNPDYD